MAEKYLKQIASSSLSQIVSANSMNAFKGIYPKNIRPLKKIRSQVCERLGQEGRRHA
jgi:hypothetical protein